MVNFHPLSVDNQHASEAVTAALAHIEGDEYDSRFVVEETDRGRAVYWGDTDKLNVEELTTMRSERGMENVGPEGTIYYIEGTEQEIRDAAERE